jgi:hypothetical protein
MNTSVMDEHGASICRVTVSGVRMQNGYIACYKEGDKLELWKGQWHKK